jgi:hypothetical protein
VEELEKVVAESVQSRLTSGQLDGSPMTVEDLRAVQRAFVDVLRGLQHPRVDYPPEVQLGQPATWPAEQSPQGAPVSVPVEQPQEPVIINHSSGATSVF